MAARLRARFPGLLVRIALKYVERIIGHRYDEFAPLHTIGRSTAPILLVHGLLDEIVPYRDAERLHAQCPERTTLLPLPNANHTDIEAIKEVKPTLLRFLHDVGVTPGPAGFDLGRMCVRSAGT